MSLIGQFDLLLLFFTAFPLHLGTDSDCVVFKHNGNNITAERDSSIILTFSISESCYQRPDDLKSVLVANVTGAGLPVSYCQFTATQGRCDEQLDNTQCTCDPVRGEYNVIIRLRGEDMEVWKVTASSAGDKKIEGLVNITLNDPQEGRSAVSSFVLIVVSAAAVTALVMVGIITATICRRRRKKKKRFGRECRIGRSTARNRPSRLVSWSPAQDRASRRVAHLPGAGAAAPVRAGTAGEAADTDDGVYRNISGGPGGASCGASSGALASAGSSFDDEIIVHDYDEIQNEYLPNPSELEHNRLEPAVAEGGDVYEPVEDILARKKKRQKAIRWSEESQL